MALAKKNGASHKAAAALYERDFYQWLNTQAAALRQGNLEALDTGNLAEEIEDMGRSQKAALRSQLARLVAHLLKWSVQRELRLKSPSSGNSWRGSISAARQEIVYLLEDSPSLRRYLDVALPKAWVLGTKWAMEDPKLPESAFPDKCPWTLKEILNDDFYPDEVAGNGSR